MTVLEILREIVDIPGDLTTPLSKEAAEAVKVIIPPSRGIVLLRSHIRDTC